MTYLQIKNFVKTAESQQSFENTLTLFLTDTSPYWQERHTLYHILKKYRRLLLTLP